MYIVECLGKRPTGKEIESHVKNMVLGSLESHERRKHTDHYETSVSRTIIEEAYRMAGHANKEMSKLKELMDYLGLEFRDEPARRIIVKKRGASKK
jgi:hypothetical protein